MQRTAIYTSILLLTLVGYSCSRKPSNVMSQEKMMDVLYDVQLAQAIYRNSYTDFEASVNKDKLIEGVLEKHDITQAELDSSLVWYADNIEIYNEINDSVRSRLKTRNDFMINAKVITESLQRKFMDSFLPPYYYLTSNAPTLSFTLDSARIRTENLLPFNLSFDVQGLPEQTVVEAALFFTYKDTVVERRLTINENVHYSFDRPPLPDDLLQSISGYAHLKSNKTSFASSVLLYNINYNKTIIPPIANDMNANKLETKTN